MTLLIDNATVEKLLTMRDTVTCLERSYAELAAGDAVCRPRIDVRIPTGDGESIYQWGSMEGGSAVSGYFATRVKSDVLTERQYGGTRTQEKHCMRPGLFCGLIFLWSTRNGEPLAIINDGALQHMRVGADSAIGVKLVARDDAEVLGMLGSGGMARSHVEALLAVRDIRRVQVYSPTRAHRERYAAEMSDRHGLEAVAVDDADQVYRGADVVCGCTDATGDVVHGDLIEPGTHVTCIGGRPDDRVNQVVDVWLRLGTAPAPVNEPGWRPTAENLAYVAQPGAPVWERHHSDRKTQRPPGPADGARVVYLEELLSGAGPGRTGAAEITYSERGNIQGAQFHAVAGHVYELAKAAGLGHELPTEWFLQDIRD